MSGRREKQDRNRIKTGNAERHSRFSGILGWAEALFGFSGLFSQISLSRGKHQLDPVELVYLAGTGVIVDCYDIGLWV